MIKSVKFDFSKNGATQSSALTEEQAQTFFESVEMPYKRFTVNGGYMYKGDNTRGAGFLKLSTTSNNGGFNLTFQDAFIKSVRVTWNGWTGADGRLVVNNLDAGYKEELGATVFEQSQLLRTVVVSSVGRVLIAKLEVFFADEDDEGFETLGQNIDAQNVLKAELTAASLASVDGVDVFGRVVDKFFEWGFPYSYAARSLRWRVAVRSWCERNAKLADLQGFYNATVADANDGVLFEQWSGKDTTRISKNPVVVSRSFKDQLARRTKTSFSGIGTTSSEALADEVLNEPVDGRDEQTEQTTTTWEGYDEQENAKGTRKEYSDGRTPLKRIEDVEASSSPVYKFINGFAQLLVEPCDE